MITRGRLAEDVHRVDLDVFILTVRCVLWARGLFPHREESLFSGRSSGFITAQNNRLGMAPDGRADCSE